MIKYSWAKYKGRPIHISDVTPEMRKEDKFFKTVTGKRMTAYLNGKFQKHFHHWEQDVIPHNNESYLHETAKAVFADTYTECLKNDRPFYLKYWQVEECRQHYKTTGIICNQVKSLGTFDLTKVFKEIKVEKRHNEFQPDIQLLTEKDNIKEQQVIYIEIFVTHKSSQKKISARKRIIEVEIKNEADIMRLRNTQLSVKDDRIVFHNFKINKVEIDYCSQRDKGCRTYCDTFFLYKNGGYEFISDSLENILSHSVAEENRIAKIDYKASVSTEKEKENYVHRLMNSNAKIKDCRYCKYIADKIRKNKKVGHFCKFLKKDVRYDEAFDCIYYRKNRTTS